MTAMTVNEDLKFGEVSKSLFKMLLELDPQKGSYIGLHEYDGKIAGISEESMKNEVQAYREYIERLSAIDRSKLTPENAFELDLALYTLNYNIFHITEIKSHRINPMNYAFMFGQLHGYVSRNYAPFDERLKSIISIVSRVPAILDEAKIMLNKKLSSVLCEYAISFSKGYEDYFNNELLKHIESNSDSPVLIEQYKAHSKKAVEAFQEFVEFLEGASDKDCRDYVLGKEKFMRLLKIGEQVDISFDELKKKGTDELTRLHTRLEEIKSIHKLDGDISRIEHEHPQEETLVDETAGTLQELIDFIRSKDIVNLPEKLNCIVAEMPRYMNFGFAAMDTAGPFEKTDESYYYVNLPDKEWDDERKEEWMTLFNYPTLKLISIHEAFPGHYTHFLNANMNPSDLSKLVTSYSYTEGWAHYSEEMMINEGYGNEDFKTEIGMLLEALIRCCRYIAAIGIHCEGMSIEEAKDFFIKNAFMQEVTAEEEAKRGAFDPGYLNYTLGKIMLKEFKERYFQRFGDSRTLKDFHNDIVSIGAPTFRIAENYLFSRA